MFVPGKSICFDPYPPGGLTPLPLPLCGKPGTVIVYYRPLENSHKVSFFAGSSNVDWLYI